MARIVAVGIATIDIINHVSTYPGADDEVRALSQLKTRGGNATNTLVLLSQLGHQCQWAGVQIDEPDLAIVERDLRHYGIGSDYCSRLAQGKMPTSYITLSEDSGSRSIVHYRDCPEYGFEQFRHIDFTDVDWLHFEGRNIVELRKMLQFCRENAPKVPVSLEVEKPREAIETLFEFADVLMFSRHYAEAKGHASASALLQAVACPGFASCTWGADGAWARAAGQLMHSPAFPPQRVVDTLGAGDTFNAGLIDAMLQGQTAKQALQAACKLAGRKCGQSGFNLNLAP